MNTKWILISALAAYSWTGAGCKEIECGEGTIERDGACAPASQTVDKAQCGPFTELQGATVRADVPADRVRLGDDDGGHRSDDRRHDVHRHRRRRLWLAVRVPAARGRQADDLRSALRLREQHARSQRPSATGARCPTTPTADGPVRARDPRVRRGRVRHEPADRRCRCRPARSTSTTAAATACPTSRCPSGRSSASASTTLRDMRPRGRDEHRRCRDAEAASTWRRATSRRFVVPKATTDKWAASGGPPVAQRHLRDDVPREAARGSRREAGVVRRHARR